MLDELRLLMTIYSQANFQSLFDFSLLLENIGCHDQNLQRKRIPLQDTISQR